MRYLLLLPLLLCFGVKAESSQSRFPLSASVVASCVIAESQILRCARGMSNPVAKPVLLDVMGVDYTYNTIIY